MGVPKSKLVPPRYGPNDIPRSVIKDPPGWAYYCSCIRGRCKCDNKTYMWLVNQTGGRYLCKKCTFTTGSIMVYRK
jgi:hypothetical protein